MTQINDVNPMDASALVEADRIKVYDVSRAQDYTLTLSQVFDTMAADASSLTTIAAYVAGDGTSQGTLEAAIVANTKALANALQASFKDGLMTTPGLAISGVLPEDFKTTQTAYYRKGSVQYSKAAADGLSFSAADTINVGLAAGQFWGIWLVQVDTAGAISTKSPSADQVYASEAAAIAALPAADAGNTVLGYITVQSNTDVAWTANTDDLTPASDCAAANFTDGTLLTAFTAGQVA